MRRALPGATAAPARWWQHLVLLLALGPRAASASAPAAAVCSLSTRHDGQAPQSELSGRTCSHSLVQVTKGARQVVVAAEEDSVAPVPSLVSANSAVVAGRGANQAAKCSEDEDCSWHASCADGFCRTLPLWTIPWADLAFGALSFVIAGISLAAGVGGGGLFVPMLMLILSFDARTATGLSQSMLLGGAAAAFAYNLGQSHPTCPSRPLIDFELACLLGPALMTGAQVGSLVHAVAPPAVLLLLLCLVLLDAARKSVASALKIRAKEMERAARAAKREEPASPTTQGQLNDPNAGASPQLKLFCLWLFTCAVILAKGLLLELCSPYWWVVVVLSSLGLLATALYFASELSTRPPERGGLDFSELAFPLVRWCLLAGMVAALCGIGGGMVIGPILVGLKVPPPVSSATTATTLLLISSSTALVYWVRGLVPQNYSVYLSIMTACGATTGKHVIGGWVKRTGRDSVIVWCLAGITMVSCGLMGGLGLYRVKLLGREAFAFSGLCDQHGP